MRGLLLGGAAMAQEAAGDDDGGQIWLQHQRLAHRLHHDRGLDRAGAEAAVFFRERKAEQALFGKLAPDGLAPAALLGAVFLARVEVVAIVQETVDAFLEKPLLLGQIKIHVVYSLRLSMRGDALAPSSPRHPREGGDPVIAGGRRKPRPPRRTGSPAPVRIAHKAEDDSCCCRAARPTTPTPPW